MIAAISLAVFVSCSGSTDTKTITPTSTEFTSGELAKYVEIVDQPSELTFAEKDGAIATQYIRLKVTLKKIKDGFRNTDARDINFTSLLSVAVIKLVDENGTDVQKISVKSEELLKLKKLLISKKGDTAEIIFEGFFYNHDKAPSWFKETEQFTPYLSADISVERSSISYDDEESYEEDEESYEEDDDDDNDDSYETDDDSSSDSEDWDSVLDSYKEYVDDYISLMKKAKKGDVDALAEYPSILENAQELGEKLQKAKGSMSSSQLSRYTRITNKMTQAIADMQ